MTAEADATEETPESNLTCFVIGPIGNRLAPVDSAERNTYEEALRVMEEVIEPACRRVGLTPVRADGLARAGEITEQVFRRLRDDDVVIADLTGANANVMYELGLRHTEDKLTVQLGEFGRLPFDINVIRTIRFSRSPVGLINARDELAEVLATGVAGEYDPVTATRVWGERDSAPVTPEDGPDIPDEDASDSTDGPDATASEDDDERGFIDVMVEAEEQQDVLVPRLEAVGQHIVALGELAEAATQKTERSDAVGKGMRGRLQILTKYAAGLDRIASALQGDVDQYADALAGVSAGNLEIIKRLEEDPSQLAEHDPMEFGMVLRQTAATTRESFGHLAEMVEGINENAKLSRVLRGPSAKLTSALNRLVEATSVVDEWDRRLQSLGVPVPPADWQPESDEETDSSEESGGAEESGDAEATDGPDDGEDDEQDGDESDQDGRDSGSS